MTTLGSQGPVPNTRAARVDAGDSARPASGRGYAAKHLGTGEPSAGDPVVGADIPAGSGLPLGRPANCSEQTAAELFAPTDFARHWAACQAAARVIVRNDDLARDVAQEALVAAWRYRHRYDPAKATPEAWLMGLVRHKAIDRVRHEESQRDRVRRAAREIREHPVEPADAVIREESRTAVRTALAALTPAHREILVLAYFGALSQREVAGLTGLPIGTVKSRTYSALRRLHELLSPTETPAAPRPLPVHNSGVKRRWGSAGTVRDGG